MPGYWHWDVPQTAVCGGVSLTVANQTSNSRAIVIVGQSCPVVLADIRAGGAPGDVVVLEGTGWRVDRPSDNVVEFTSAAGAVTAAVLQASSTQLHVRIPDTAIAGDVRVTVGGQVSNPLVYQRN